MATYYWVGGSGTWNSTTTTNWSLTSGGSGGGGVPTSVDTVNFDANSGTAATVTVADTAACNLCIVNKSDINISLGASVTLISNFNGAFTLTAGTLTLNTYTLGISRFYSSNTNARTIAFGTGTINLTAYSSGGSPVVILSPTTNIVITGTNPTLNFTSNTPTQDCSSQVGSVPTLSLNVTGNFQSFGFSSQASIKNLTFASGFTGTWSEANAVVMNGNLILSSGMTCATFGNGRELSFSGTSSQSITSNGALIQTPISITNTVGITTSGAFTTISSWTISSSTCTFDPGGTFTVASFFSSSAGLQSFGYNYIITGSGSAYTQSTARSNFSYNTGVTISLTNANAKTFAGGGSRFPGINQGGAGTLTISGNNTFKDITNSVQPATILFTAGSTQTTTALATNGTSGNLITLGSTSTSAFTITRDSSGTNNCVYCSVSYMTGNTTAATGGYVIWQFNSTTNGGNNSNLTIVALVYYWVGGSGTWNNTTTTNWSLTSGGSGNAGPPSATDAVVFNSNSSSGNYTVTIESGAVALTATIGAPSSGTLQLSGSGNLTLYGNLTISTGVIQSYTGSILFLAGASLTTNGLALSSNITFNASVASIFSLLDSLTTSGTFTLTQGTLSLGSYTLTTQNFDSSNANTRTLAFGTGNITTTGSGTVFTTSTVLGLTVTGTPIVNISNSGSTATTVSTGAISESNSISFNFTAGTYALTFLGNASDRAKNVNFTGFNGTLNATSTSTIGGSLTLSSGMTLTSSASALTFAATIRAQTNTIATAGKTLDFPITINYEPNSTLQLNDTMTIGSTRTLTLTQGTLNLNNFNLSVGIFSSSGTSIRSVGFGTAKIILTYASTTTVLSMATATGFTSTGTGGFASSMDVAQTFTIGSTAGTITTTANLFLTNGNSIATLTTGSYFKTIDFTGYSGTPATTTLYLAGYVLSTGGTFTNITARMIANGSITSNGKSIAAIDVGYSSGLGGSSYTITTISTALQGTVGTMVAAASAGTGPVGAYTGTSNNGYWVITPGWNISFNGTNYTTMYPVSNMYVTFGAGSTTSFGLSASNPALPKIMMQASDRSVQRMYYQLTGTTPNRTFWWRFEGSTGTSGVAGSPSMLYEGYIYENNPSTIDIITGTIGTGGISGVYSASALLNAAAGLGTSNTGTRITYVVVSTYPNSTTTIVDNLNVTGTLTFTSGTLTTISGNVTAGSFSTTTATAKTLVMGSGTWTITDSGATAWNVTNPSFLTVTPGSSTISMSSASDKTFVGAGKTWNNLTNSGAGQLTITDSNTFATISNSVSPATFTFTAGTTNTVSNFNINGTSGNLVTLQSSTSGSTFTISKSTGTVTTNYAAIKDSVVTGGATWLAPSNYGNVNNGNNTGWDFSAIGGTFNPGFLLFF